MVLCEKAQSEFEVFCVVPVVPVGQLYGGKIRAALDRQHPRDLFDIKGLLENGGFTQETKKGFLLCLVGSERPMHEVLYPNYQDQKSALENQFKGMTSELFTYKDYEATRENLVGMIQAELTNQDKDFLLAVKNLTPDWSLYDFQDFPSVQWKLKNLQKLKDINPEKHWLQLEALRKKLDR